MPHRSRQPAPRRPRRHLVGLGLDNEDGHKRLTSAERFTVAGGSAETHEKMTETLCKTMESLQRKGRDLDRAEPAEVADLLRQHAQQ